MMMNLLRFYRNRKAAFLIGEIGLSDFPHRIPVDNEQVLHRMDLQHLLIKPAFGGQRSELAHVRGQDHLSPSPQAPDIRFGGERQLDGPESPWTISWFLSITAPGELKASA